MHIGIPAHRERAWLPATLNALAHQEDTRFEVTVCVNQPASWAADPAHADATAENRDTLAWLAREAPHLPFPLHVVDAVDREPPPDAAAGVGWARARLFDGLADADGICLSLDADTLTAPNYTAAVREAFARRPNAVGLALPYYHRLPDDAIQALHLLRYELYMRTYQIQLWRIGSPYAFLPLGSAMAFRGRAYRAAGGMPHRRAGEDFYFLQRLRKLGPLMRHVPTTVYPAARPSDRVPFGTGPLLAEADLGLQEARFPFYAGAAFALLETSFALFPRLYHEDVPLPVDPYLSAAMRRPGTYARMRRTLPDEARFVRACHERLDGLRTLQVLRAYQAQAGPSDAEAEINALLKQLGEPPVEVVWDTAHVPALDALRDRLAAVEAGYQRRFMEAWDPRATW